MLRIVDAKARWLGRELLAEVTIAVDNTQSLAAANGIAANLKAELFEHLPALKAANVRFDSSAADDIAVSPHQGHHHASDPFQVFDVLAVGVLEIVDTDAGERLRLTTRRMAEALEATVTISRAAGPETLVLQPVAGSEGVFMSAIAPEEPHEFDAVLRLSAGANTSSLPFHMAGPEHHH